MPLELLQTGAPEGTTDQDYLWTLNFGPQHPATHTTLRLILTLDGESIIKAVPDIGFLHSGFEKLGEDLDYNQYVTIVDRSEEHTSELQSLTNLVCRLLLEKKKNNIHNDEGQKKKNCNNSTEYDAYNVKDQDE